jgi:hypothetical protein
MGHWKLQYHVMLQICAWFGVSLHLYFFCLASILLNVMYISSASHPAHCSLNPGNESFWS